MADMHVNKKWTNEEIKILEELYPKGGYKEVQKMLPHRKSKAISEKARSLGIKSNNQREYFSNEEIEMLKIYYPIGGIELVKKHIPNRSDAVISQKASQLKLKFRSDLYTDKEDEIIRKYYPSHGLSKIKKLLPNRTETSIHNRAFSLGVKYLTYDKDYFENIDTPEKAYWLGFIYTDGYVTTNNRWGVSLGIKDLSHLKKLLDAFNCNVKIRTRSRKENFGHNNGAIYEECSFQINNSKMHKDLVEKGVTRNKTTTLSFPSENILSDEMYSHFIRGLFDGDGSYIFYESFQVRRDRDNKLCPRITKEISFVCASFEFINSLSEILAEKCNIIVKPVLNKRDNLYVLRLQNKQNMKTFIDFVYKNSNVHLDRKYKKAQEILKYCLA